MGRLVLKHLADVPHHAPALARWHQTEWRHLEPGSSVESRTQELLLARRDAIPMTVVAEVDGVLAGSASLIDSDMDTHPELGPWLASVYVAESVRRRGIGEALVRRIVVEARALATPTLYLFTPHHERMYAQLGWSLVRHEVYYGADVAVMRLAPG
jgi:predicted N-acetyltransferase YhbS